MHSFIDNVVRQVISSQKKVSKCTFILPSKRAGLFLKQSIKTNLNGPSILPEIYSIEEFIEQFNGVIIANELFDAIPADVFASFENEIMEKKVGVIDQSFTWILSENKKYFDYEIALGDGIFEFEYSADYKKIFSEFSKAEQMVCFLFDYGMDERQLFHSSRPRGTLRGFKKNLLSENIFQDIGDQDITYHVNFTHLAF